MSAFLDGLIARLRETFNAEAAGHQAARLLESAVVAAAVIAAYYLLWRLISPVVNAILRRANADRTTAAFTGTVVKYSVLTAGGVHALGAAGINTAGVLTSLGIAGLTVGFAAKDALSNIISGILIFWDRPFVIGDLIEIGGRYGRVEAITLRSTRVVTVDGKMLAVPNTEVINTTVASYTNFPTIRLDIPATIGLEEDIPRVRSVLLDLVTAEEGFLTKPSPTVVVKALNDYNIEVELRAWIEDERSHIPRRFELRERMFEALRANGIEMPLETIELAPLTVSRVDVTDRSP